jgi:hypothetical protein
MRVLFLIGSFILFDKLHYTQSGLISKRWEETNKSDKRKLHDTLIKITLLFNELLGGNRDPRSSSFSFSKKPNLFENLSEKTTFKEQFIDTSLNLFRFTKWCSFLFQNIRNKLIDSFFRGSSDGAVRKEKKHFTNVRNMKHQVSNS